MLKYCATRVRVSYRNHARTRAGKRKPGTVTFEIDGEIVFRLHTVYGAAKELGLSAVRIQQLLETGKVRGYRIGRDWLVLDLDLRKFVADKFRYPINYMTKRVV